MHTVAIHLNIPESFPLPPISLILTNLLYHLISLRQTEQSSGWCGGGGVVSQSNGHFYLVQETLFLIKSSGIKYVSYCVETESKDFQIKIY